MKLHRLLLFPLLAALCWGTSQPALAALWITNYSSLHPLKIMPVGDSITDDCSISGAWRQYLQVLLDNGGVPFTFVGRNQSVPSLNFTKVRHEGYCGAVVAPPGVVSNAVYSYAATNVYLEKIVADALLANAPDLILILIGANDIGRGRDPYVVATNDIPALLSVIAARAPNAHVILTKPTSLQDANMLGYGNYATNVPIYSAALQKVVNDRQAAGQQVYLADMFSVVDYTSMFNPDHIHPNNSGLVAIAREFYARIQSILVRPDQVTTSLINGGSVWSYSDQGVDFGTNWVQPNFDDRGWSNGLGRLGYADLGTATTIGFGADPMNRYPTTYFRKSFFVPWTLAVTNLNFRLARRDGAVVWLNGQEVYRVNLSNGPIAWTNLALKAMTGFTPQIYYPTNRLSPWLLAGPNLLAVEVHQSAPTNESLGFDLELLASGTKLPVPRLSISSSPSNVTLSWPIASGAGYSLYTSPAVVPTSWGPATNQIQTNGAWLTTPLSATDSGQFFRLQRP